MTAQHRQPATEARKEPPFAPNMTAGSRLMKARPTATNSRPLPWSRSSALTSVGEYVVTIIGDRYHVTLEHKGQRQRIGDGYPTPAAAKAAAQVHFRVNSKEAQE